MLNYNYFIQITEFALLGLYAFFFLIQLYYYIYFFTTPFWSHKPKLSNINKPLSVIICAKNEAENLRNNLQAILEQKYPNYEVIVVNDCSEDDTDMVLAEYLNKYKHLRTTSIQPDRKFSHGKKLAVTVGIKSAKNEHLVFTDADCKTVSENWLSTMVSNFDEKEIILAYGGYEHKKGLLNKYIRYDAAMIAIQYLGLAIRRIPYMGVGRNLAYTKSLFFKNKGFASHYGLPSGDDDLFINEAATKNNIAIEFRIDSHTRSVPKERWSDWFKQKVRHFSTSKRYKSKHKFLLGLEPVSRLGFYALFTLTLIATEYLYPILAVFAIRLIFQILVNNIINRKLNDKKLFLLFSIFDLVSLFINFSIYITTLFRLRKLQWK